MRIYDTNQQPAGIGTGQTREAQRTATTETKIGAGQQARGAAKADAVELSGVATELTTGAGSVDREARVAELAALYKTGQYKVDAEAVSARVIDDAITSR